MQLYPQRARSELVGGFVRLGCEITTEGRTANCLVLDECPAQLGFGEASLQAVASFTFTPKLVDGRPAVSHIVIPLRWSLSGVNVPQDCPPAAARAHAWARTPDQSDPQSLFPAKALADGENGSARILCQVGGDGQLVNCAVREEYPRNYGFGAEGLMLAGQYRMKRADGAGASNPSETAEIAFSWSTGLQNVARPVWVERPSRSELDELAPAKAKLAGLTGSANLVCAVDLELRPADCQVLDETPEGYGYGEAAIAASRYFRLAPRNGLGLPVLNSQLGTPRGVIVDVRW